MRYKIAVNPTIRGKLPRDATPGQWARFNDTFDNCELTAAQIATAIQAGHAIAPWHAGRRKRDNWQLAQHIGIDLDDGALSWDEVTALPLVDQHAAIVHMTASSTPAHPRMRVLFLLDEPCDDPDTYTFIVGCFLRAFATADPHGPRPTTTRPRRGLSDLGRPATRPRGRTPRETALSFPPPIYRPPGVRRTRPPCWPASTMRPMGQNGRHSETLRSPSGDMWPAATTQRQRRGRCYGRRLKPAAPLWGVCPRHTRR